MKFRIFFGIICCLQTTQSANNNDPCIKSNTIVNGIPIKCRGELLFSDDFDGKSLDSFRWNISSSSNNYYLKDGKLHINVDPTMTTSSFAITSKFKFKYGHVNIRIQIIEKGYEDDTFSIDFGFASLESDNDHKIIVGKLCESNYYHQLWEMYPHVYQSTYDLIWNETESKLKFNRKEDIKQEMQEYFNHNERTISFEICNDKNSHSQSFEIVVDYIRVYSTDKYGFITPCEPALTEVWPSVKNEQICKDSVIFQDEFKILDRKKWMLEVHGPRYKRDDEFVLSDGDAGIKIHNNKTSSKIILKPQLLSDYRPDLNILRSTLNLTDHCTSLIYEEHECYLRSFGQFILPPVVAPRLNTRNSFAFKYGRIDIGAKVPNGDWIVPLLLLEPLFESYGKTGYDSGQLRVAMIRGNEMLESVNNETVGGHTLYGGAVLSPDAKWRTHFMVNRTQSEHYANDLHVYSMEWRPDKLEFFVDGESYGILYRDFKDPLLNRKWKNGEPMAPFDNLFYITLGISVGGFGDFDEDLKWKPWRNYDPKARLHFWQHLNEWYPTWKQPELEIHFVVVFAI